MIIFFKGCVLKFFFISNKDYIIKKYNNFFKLIIISLLKYSTQIAIYRLKVYKKSY